MGLLFIFGTCKQNLQIRIGIGLLLQCISMTVVVCSYDLTLLSGLGRGGDNLVSVVSRFNVHLQLRLIYRKQFYPF